MRKEYNDRWNAPLVNPGFTHDSYSCGCEESECEECNPITEEDVICNRCGEHSEMRELTGTECCNAGSRF